MVTAVKSETAGFEAIMRKKISELENNLEKEVSEMKKEIAELKKRVTELEDENTSLKLKNSGLELKLNNNDNKQDAGTSNVFDCYLTENWDTDGIITFNGCSGIVCHNKIELKMNILYHSLISGFLSWLTI